VKRGEGGKRKTPLAGDEPLIDVHAHFYHSEAGRADWRDLNAARFRAGERIGITWHVASVLGSYGFRSPTYFPSPEDVVVGNDAMLEIEAHERARVRMYATVNPNYTGHALAEIERCGARGAVGVKLLASRRADDALLDPIAELAAERGFPILHHVWQHRRREWPSQEISDGADLARLAARHPRATFILAHIGGGGDWSHTFPAIAEYSNIYPDVSGSGVDRGMLDVALESLGPARLLWGCDLTMETGLAKLRALEAIGLEKDQMSLIRWGNAVRIFPRGAFPGIDAGSQRPERGVAPAARRPPPAARR
jgi:predicted TIM-barrel fold metal-dependent hydrolase